MENLTPESTGIALGTIGDRKIEQPIVGSTIMLRFTPWGIYEAKDGQHITNGEEYTEVEIKSIKKATITFN